MLDAILSANINLTAQTRADDPWQAKCICIFFSIINRTLW